MIKTEIKLDNSICKKLKCRVSHVTNYNPFPIIKNGRILCNVFLSNGKGGTCYMGEKNCCFTCRNGINCFSKNYSFMSSKEADFVAFILMSELKDKYCGKRSI